MNEWAEPPGSGAAASPEEARGARAAFDECFSCASAIRPHWHPLVSSLKRLGREELIARTGDIQRILAENGVSRFVNRDGGTEEPWRLDLVPLVLGRDDWRELEAGLIQRARLLNLILCDLYGTQHLVRDGLVPAALLYANPGFLRACQAIRVKGGVYLQVYAADLGRSPDGRWWVLADRTQAPSGLGFTLENRAVLSRVLPETMREVRPRAVSDALRIRRETLRRFAPAHADQPAMVLLTPGPRHEAYFEHVFLSRLLGLTLVEGGDLTVRDRRLFIKTLDGLRRADVVLRRLNDAFCDPLELREDSLLGVPGLVEAARAGQVTLGNALGSGLLENAAFLPFLPGICRHLLDEEPRLPSIGTWWCGQSAEQAYVRERLDQLVVRPAFAPAGGARPAGLSAAERAALLERLSLRPHEFVGQERFELSRAPVCAASGSLGSAPVMMRLLVLHDGEDFTVIPGGLARIAPRNHAHPFAPPPGGLTKDVWVLPENSEAEPQAQVLSEAGLAPGRAPSDLPSRAADNLFWLGRYTERLEQIVRVARLVFGRLGGEFSPGGRSLVESLRQMLGELGLTAKAGAAPGSREELQRDLLELVFGETRRGGVAELIERIHQTAFCVRDRLSADTWRILNGLRRGPASRTGGLPVVRAQGVLRALVRDLAAFSGMEMENMTRGHGWVFLDLGRRMERGIFIARLVRAVILGESRLNPLFEAALETADSAMTHRRRYFSEPRLATVLEVLVEDASNPRSLAFQIASLRGHAETLPEGANPEGVALVRGAVRELEGRVRQCRVEPGMAEEAGAKRVADALAGIVTGLEELSELLTQVYFSHVTPRMS
jgi:uncharacterized circularly permuted ATP-grasp superfamily protein/uncharacterized alpha-E superfamily protein